LADFHILRNNLFLKGGSDYLSSPDKHPARRAPIAFVVATIVLTWGLGTPSPWLDEAATLAVSSRSYDEILFLGRHVDGVLVPYYLLVHAITDSTVWSIRLISALSMASAAAALVVLCGRLAASRMAVVCTFATLILSPAASRFGQEARPYALAVAAATVASLCLVIALQRADARKTTDVENLGGLLTWSRIGYAWPCYIISVTALGYFQIIGLLILAAHGITVFLLARKRILAWAWSASISALVCAPLAVVGSREKNAVAWITAPHLSQLLNYPLWVTGFADLSWLLLLASLAGYLFGRLSSGSFSTAQERLLAVGAPWAVAPPILLYLASRVTPLYQVRYLLFTLPGWALVIGVGIASLPRLAVPPILVVALWFSFPVQQEMRSASGHGDNSRAMAIFIRDRKEKGDGAVFNPADKRLVSEAFQEEFSGIREPLVNRDPAKIGELSGGLIQAQDVGRSLQGYLRVWVLSTPSSRFMDPIPTQATSIVKARYTLLGSWSFPPFSVSL
jgi:mannosyltransferase